MTEKLETEIIRAEKHCVSCLHWNGVICAVFRKRKEAKNLTRGVTKMTKIYTTIKETAAMVAVGTIGGAIAWGVMELEQLAKAWQF